MYQRGKKASIQPPSSPSAWTQPHSPPSFVPRRTPDDIEQLIRSFTLRPAKSPLVPPTSQLQTPAPVPTSTFHFLTPPPSPDLPSPYRYKSEITLNSPPRSQAPSPTFPPFILDPAPAPPQFKHQPSASFADEDQAAHQVFTPPATATATADAGAELEMLRMQLSVRHELQQLHLRQAISLPDMRAWSEPEPVSAPQERDKVFEFKAGDWYCPKQDCGFHNFFRKLECHRCGCPAPSDTWLDYVRRRTAIRKTNEEKQVEMFADGDWRCECGFINFKRRSVCWHCHPEHPSHQDLRAPLEALPPSASAAVLFPLASPIPRSPLRHGEILRVDLNVRSRSRSASSPQH